MTLLEAKILATRISALLVVVLIVMAALIFTPQVSAQVSVIPFQDETPPAGNDTIADVITGALTTIGLVLLLYSLPSLAHAYRQGEKFDKRKIAKTLLMGAVVGAFLGFQGMGVSDESVAFAEQFVQLGFGGIIVVFLDKVLTYLFGPEVAARSR